jgi:uncharacterized protein (TIGR00645 family)
VSERKRNYGGGFIGGMKKTEHFIESMLFNGRWLLIPFYVGLLLGLVVLVFKFVQEFVHLMSITMSSSLKATTISLLELLDIVLLANLILIVIFSGYENFVSKIAIAQDAVDRPSWMGKVDFSGLKIKLIGSLVAISVTPSAWGVIVTPRCGPVRSGTESAAIAPGDWHQNAQVTIQATAKARAHPIRSITRFSDLIILASPVSPVCPRPAPLRASPDG